MPEMPADLVLTMCRRAAALTDVLLYDLVLIHCSDHCTVHAADTVFGTVRLVFSWLMRAELGGLTAVLSSSRNRSIMCSHQSISMVTVSAHGHRPSTHCCTAHGHAQSRHFGQPRISGRHFAGRHFGHFLWKMAFSAVCRNARNAGISGPRLKCPTLKTDARNAG